ncbi:MAG: hypothetical protein E6750_19710 [Atlantibacter hermannii]|uniref:hypothetical protein n=1 Tax=Atlantibacter hermannii TaxID=565 RepID=UPI002904AE2A|nr:hypothetical protein [Atlantibacter hermannii]MDU1953611.1 hypothetical protein [Atlantibacter hermannii]
MTDNNKHLVRVGHEFAAAMSDDTPIITIAKMVTELASALDVQSARSDALAAELKKSKIDAECYKHGMEQSNKRLTEIAAENAALKDFVKTCFRAAGDGCDMDGNDIQELGERLGLFGRETYQPVLHGYICGHEAGEDTVYVMKKSPATDAWVNEQQAVGVEKFADFWEENCRHNDTFIGGEAKKFAAQLRGSQV